MKDYFVNAMAISESSRQNHKTKHNFAYFKLVVERSKLLSRLTNIRTAENIIWKHVYNKTHDFNLAEMITNGLIKLHPVIMEQRHQLAEEQLEERYYKLITIYDRIALRKTVGNAPVDELKFREKEAKRRYEVASRTALCHRGSNDEMISLRVEALNKWEEEKKAIQIDYEILCYGGKEKYETAMNKFPNSVRSDSHTKNQFKQETNIAKSTFQAPDSIDSNRNTTLHKTACCLFAKNLSPEAVWAALEAENSEKCYEPLPSKELQQLFRSAEKYHKQKTDDCKTGRQERFTDQANAQRLVNEHGEYIRYIATFRKWFVFDGSRWINDPPGGLYTFVRRTLEGLYHYALALEGENRSRLLKELMSLEALNRQRTMIDMAATLPAIIINPNQLDLNPYLLNLNNGTLNLRTGVLQHHDPRNFITKLAPVSFDPLAKCPTWEGCIFRIMNGNEEMIAFLQRALGYSLTGDTGEQCFFIPYGSGANGKSTVLNTIRALLGDYAMQAAPDMLMVKSYQSGANNDLARLPGSRFVATSETEDGQRFAESALKQMTGQDTITARFLYSEFFEFKPQFKIWLATNHKPVVRGTDNAIWRRIHLIPFTVTIPENEQDKKLDAKLTLEHSGILNWVLEGCLEWQRMGLQPPQEVRSAVSAYRKDMDIFSQWLEECCVQVPSVITQSKELYESYKVWCDANTGWSMSQTKFGRTLTDRGFTSVKTPHSAWRGIGLLTERF